MATVIQPNGAIGQRAKQSNAVRKLKDDINNLQAIIDAPTFATLLAATTAIKLLARVLLTLVRYQVNEIKRREGG